MNILITGGGCEEPIDTVRSICNFSTGKTAAQIARCLLETDASVRITAIVAQKAEKPDDERCTVRTFRTFSDLFRLIKEECESDRYDAVIHAAAVSDYSPESIVINGTEFPVGSIAKIDSQSRLTIHMRRNPKIIESIKTWTDSSCVLFGFKLTSNATGEERKAAVQKLFSAENPPDFVASNDLSEITPEHHPFRLYSNTGFLTECASVPELSAKIIALIQNRDEHSAQGNPESCDVFVPS